MTPTTSDTTPLTEASNGKPYTLITGASKGIGKSFAYECASRGMNLFLVARSQPLLEALAAELRTRYAVAVALLPIDLLEPASHKIVFQWAQQHHISVNMLLNNAGMGYYGKFAKRPLEKHLQVLHLNVDAQLRMAYEFLNCSDPTQRRYLLHTVSTGAFQPVPNMAVYSASKSFMLSLSRALRFELRQENVYVTALCPGGTQTDFFGPAEMERVVQKNTFFMMDSPTVARQGIAGLLANKAVVIPGLYNKLGAWSARHAPQGIVVRVAAQLFA